MQPKNASFRREHYFKFSINGLIESQLFLFDRVLVSGLQHIVCGVAHALHAVFIRDADGQHGGGVCVAQIVEPEVRDTGLFTDAGEAAVNGLAGEVHNEFIVAGLVCQQILDVRREPDFALAGIGLCAFLGGAVFAHDNGLTDLQDIAFDAGPCEADDLRLTKAQPDGKGDGQFVFGAACGIYDPDQFRLGGDLNVRADLLGKRGVQHHVRMIFTEHGGNQTVGIGTGLWGRAAGKGIDPALDLILREIGKLRGFNLFNAGFLNPFVAANGGRGLVGGFGFNVLLNGFFNGEGGGITRRFFLAGFDTGGPVQGLFICFKLLAAALAVHLHLDNPLTVFFLFWLW